MNFRSPTALPLKFSLAVSGEGRLIAAFIKSVKKEFPGVTIYDRNEEAARPPSPLRIPAHPKVADIDALFVQDGASESLTLRNRRRHRYFNYVSDPALAREADLNRTLKQILAALKEMTGDDP